MNTPNVLTVMPGEVYRGPDPEGAMTRDEFVASVLAYAERQALPLESGTAVRTVEPDDRGGFAVRTPQGVVRLRNVVATTGNLNVPKRPALAGPAGLPRHRRNGRVPATRASGERVASWRLAEQRELGSERKAAEAKLKELNDELEQRVAARTASLTRSNRGTTRGP